MSEEVFVTTKDRPGSYDAIATAKPGEPLFPVQGGDPFGPPTVQFWADQCRRAGMAEEDEKKANALLRKASDAEQVVWAMLSYQRGEVEVAPKRATYNDAQPDIRDGDDARKQREALIRSAERIHNAIAAANEAAEALAKFRVHPEAEVKIREAMEQLREAAFTIEPRRGNERS